ncbi:hypothetical protein DQ04_01881060 [Trypanosoma grayi]|uniref:hypothetical protein n=1 Tax=Trypanosoma grayi TaxID=71804 RepID=UPI0004F4B6D9|nr:hypothetical protein DQ04_01881060 [Trypanosoma grayi]KEG12222.1 hypothetical protein DQ04_01881060 [Trypanosoma grayi]
MADVALDIGSRLTKVYLGGNATRKCVFETPPAVQRMKERFDHTSTRAELDSFLHRVSCAACLWGSHGCVEVLSSADDSPLFTQYVMRWLSSVSLDRQPMLRDAHSWLLGAHGLTDGCVVDIGYGATRIVPILCGIPVVEAITIGRGMRVLLAPSPEGVVASLVSTSPPSSPPQLQIPAEEVAQWIIAHVEEAMLLCNSQTQRPFVCGVFLLSGGGIAVRELLEGLQSAIQTSRPYAHVLVFDDSVPMLCASVFSR